MNIKGITCKKLYIEHIDAFTFTLTVIIELMTSDTHFYNIICSVILVSKIFENQETYQQFKH